MANAELFTQVAQLYAQFERMNFDDKCGFVKRLNQQVAKSSNLPDLQALLDYCKIRIGDVEVGNTFGNLNNSAFAVEKGGWVYLLGGLKFRPDGSDAMPINDDSGDSLNVVGGWLYYKSFDDNQIRKIHISGDNEREDVGDAVCSRFVVVDDWIYFSNLRDDEKAYKIRTDGTEKTKLNDFRSGYYNVIGDWVYYVSLGVKVDYASGNIRKMMIDGSKDSILCEDECADINVVGNQIYFVNSSKSRTFWKMGINGENPVQLFDGAGGWLVIDGDWAYYSDLPINGCNLIRRRLDGSEMSVVCRDFVTLPCVLNDYAYYMVGPLQPGSFCRVKLDDAEGQREVMSDVADSRNARDEVQCPFEQREFDCALDRKGEDRPAYLENVVFRYIINVKNSPDMLKKLQAQLAEMTIAQKEDKLVRMINSWR